MNQCPRCGSESSQRMCCGEVLHRRRWKMTKERVRALRVLAHAQKGLDKETYRLRLQAIGVDSTLDLSREQYVQFIVGLRALPNAPGWRRRRA